MHGENLLPGDTSDVRSAVVQIALAEVGMRKDPLVYWREVLPTSWTSAQVEQFSKNAAWCGGFALWCLRKAGLAADIDWAMGKGFCYRLATTKDPLAGDIAYFDQPYQHHAVFWERRELDVVTIDGNQAGGAVAIVRRPFSRASAYYSIASLIDSVTA
jgi:hypothetical protein